MKSKDQIFRFLVDHTPIRGQLISLDASWQQCFQQSDAGELAKTLLGHALSATTLLASSLKIDGSLTLQIRGQGAIHLLVTEATNNRTIRGLVRQSREVDNPEASLKEIFEADKIVFTIDNGKGKPHQGIVPLSGSNLSEALEAYFEQSEQLPTRLWLACNESSASGLLLQKLPESSKTEHHEDTDSWNRLTQLASTITDQELLELDENEILHRLFHEESIRLFDAEPVRFQCSCSRNKTSNMIKSLGKTEADDILTEKGKIQVSCEFCNAIYEFDSVDVKQLFESDINLPDKKTTH